MSLQYFGTDGIRGKYGSDPISTEFSKKIAQGFVSFLLANDVTDTDLSVVIGRDTRGSGEALKTAFSKTFQSLGVDVLDMEICPTPQVAYATSETNACLGLAITASHNPVEDNGFKFFKSDGTKFSPSDELEIEKHIENPRLPVDKDTGSEVVSIRAQTQESYFALLSKAFNRLDLQGLRLLVDTANGATYKSTPHFLESLGASVTTKGDQPDGTNINVGVGSEYPQAICHSVKEGNYDYGIAHDGDGDRVILVDCDGEVLTGEHFMAIIAKYSPSIACSPDHPLVTTSMSNYAINAFLDKDDIATIRTDVGDRNVAYEMFDRNCLFGGENSGHYICADVLKTGDGLVAILKLFEAIQASEKTLSELKIEMSLYPSKLVNLRVNEKRPIAELETVNSAVLAAEKEINGKGRILIRYSGTENKIRVLVECESTAILEASLKAIVQAVQSDLEVIDS